MSQIVRKELLTQLQHLRTEAKEIGRVYVANLQRDIVQLIEFLNETDNQTAKRKNSRSTNPVFSQMKDTLDGINLKPEKGRRKDLRRIEQAIRSMRKVAFSGKKNT